MSAEGIRLERYSPALRTVWDRHVERAKNGHFQFYRSYMEYHQDRFTDASMLFYGASPDPLAVLPANRKGDTLSSHAGLSFGGLVVAPDIRVPEVLAVMGRLVSEAKDQGVTTLVYKALPWFYHSRPAQEDLYALYRVGAKLYRRDITTMVPLTVPLEFEKGRRWGVKKGQKAGVTVRESQDLTSFWEVLTHVLGSRHQVNPVHSLAEMEGLAKSFPQNIRLFGAFVQDKMVAGTLVYENRHIAHSQYMANSEEGRRVCALDVLIDAVLRHYQGNKQYFDFGTSTEDGGHVLNEGLVNYKSDFGGAAAMHDYYEVDIVAASQVALKGPAKPPVGPSEASQA